MQHRSINVVPFSTPVILNGKADAGEIILNVLIFIPLGIYAGLLFDSWNFGRKLLFFFLVSLIIETFQFAFAVGAFDSTDIITNTFGGIVGLLICKAIEKALNNRVKAQKFINVIASIATVLMIVLLALLKLNMLPVRYQ
jgi:glycopeptide antibiotics resistance protein